MINTLFPLSIFPQGSLASSVITTVWVGVFVVAFFNLRFGWVLSGLVVPGYLVPLLLIKPWAVAAILVEGVTAYYLVWLFSEYLSRYGLWSALFGRDRFFALILASIITRVTFDGWILPASGVWLQGVGIVFDYRNELHSLGLVIVALVANQFWKTGVIRGMPPLIVTLFVTWLIVKYVLMEFTNFGLGGLSYMYEDLAASILASPKAYIILVTTAFVASRMNLRYGWDFNGILIPALLALQWYEPTKILISFAESFIILGLAIATLKLPLFANSTIEGARKLLLFFNIALLYKIILSYVLMYVAPDVKISDYFAFGYLLSTLLAMKMHDKGIAIRMTRATIQTSIVSIVFASILGYLLTMLPYYQTWATSASHQENTDTIEVNTSLFRKIQNLKPDIYRSRFTEISIPLPQEIDSFAAGAELIKKYSNNGDKEILKQGLAYLKQVGYKVELLESQYLVLTEETNNRNWGIYVINLKAENELLIELPSPIEERGLVEGATALFELLNARTLSIAGGNSKKYNNQTLFDAFHRLAGRRDVLQVHAYSKEIERSLSATNGTVKLKDSKLLAGELWVKNRLPPSLDLSGLQLAVGKYEVNWGEINYKNIQRDDSREGFAEIVINRKGLRRLLIGTLLKADKTAFQVGDQRIDGFLQEWLLGKKGQIAESGTDTYQIPATEELLYLDDEVITPMLSIMETGYLNGEWTSDALDELQTINGAAGVLGYQILRYRHSQTKNDYLILSELNQHSRRYWGTYVFRLGKADPYIIQSPRPLFEVNSFEVAVSLFERIRAKALLIGGTHPLTNRDYSSDLVRASNQRSLFTLVNQVVLREQDANPLLAIQCRALGQQFGEQLPDADMLISFDDGAIHESSFSILQKQLITSLSADNWQLRFVDGSLETSGYQVGGTPQARYVNASKNKGFALLWVSPLVRSSFKQQRQDDALSIQFLSLGIPSIEADLFNIINKQDNAKISTVDTSIIDNLKKYQDTQDIVLLDKLQHADKSLQRVIDTHTKQAYLLVHNAKDQLVIVGNLNPLDVSTTYKISSRKLNRQSMSDYIETRTANLVFE